ncbi:MAG: flagellar M-ring protein FliF [Acidobacteriota bacterium]|nr:MAG: flagellar M-ring protein FliF [Acidobacteriota bacterium]
MQEMIQQLTAVWAALSLRQRFSLALSATLSVLAVVAIVWWARQPTWSVLYTGLEPREAQGIVEELQARKVRHRLADGGRVIEVPLESVDRLRMDLAATDLPQSGRFGFTQMFAQDTLAQSNRMQRVRFQKALEDELARTIESLDEVRSARVHLVLPGDRVFLDDEDVAKASVTLGLLGGRQPNSQQVQAIARIVAGAVPELTPDRVSVVDTTGRMLWDGGGEHGAMAGSTKAEMQAAIEGEINAKVARVLEPIIGPDRFVVRTTADLYWQKVLRHERQLDPDSGVLVSEQKRKEKMSGGVALQGTPGTGSNLPNAAMTAPSETSELTDLTSNFEYSSIERTIEEPQGSLRRLSVAVLVDHKWQQEGQQAPPGGDAQAEPRSVPRSPEELVSNEELVKAAISFDETRGDQVTVEQAPFQLREIADVPAHFDPLTWLPFVKYPALVVLLLLAFVLFYRPLIGTLRDAFGRAGRGEAGFATARLDQPLQLGPPSRVEQLRQRLAKLANEEPQGMAQSMRVWLHEDKGQS